MGKRLCKVHEADNIGIAKTLVFKSQPYISGDEKLEIVGETIVRSSLYRRGKPYILEQASCPSKSLYVEWVILVHGCNYTKYDI
jgi:hypothetical protein